MVCQLASIYIYKIIVEAFVCGSRDWIVLCSEKNQSEASKSYFTWQWANASKQKKKTVVFPAKHLPEDLNSYVFVYIDGTGATIGTSKPFRFGLPSDATEDITTSQYESLVVERQVSTQNSAADFEIVRSIEVAMKCRSYRFEARCTHRLFRQNPVKELSRKSFARKTTANVRSVLRSLGGYEVSQ